MFQDAIYSGFYQVTLLIFDHMTRPEFFKRANYNRNFLQCLQIEVQWDLVAFKCLYVQ